MAIFVVFSLKIKNLEKYFSRFRTLVYLYFECAFEFPSGNPQHFIVEKNFSWSKFAMFLITIFSPTT